MPALRQRDFVLRASFRVVGSCEPTFGPEDEGLGVDFAVVVEAVEGCAEQGSWREKVALDRAASCSDFTREVSRDWGCHAEGFVDEGAQVFAAVQFRATRDFCGMLKGRFDLSSQFLLHARVVRQVESHGSHCDGRRVATSYGEDLALAEELVEVVAWGAGQGVFGVEEVVEEVASFGAQALLDFFLGFGAFGQVLRDELLPLDHRVGDCVL